MCGIAGSIKRDKAFELYKSNLNRGFYSSGAISLNENGKWRETHKVLGQFEEPIGPATEIYFLYHSRGPTVETKEFNPENNHPFFYGPWIVAHNGIITNFSELCCTYFPGTDFSGRTDSCIIPRMLTIRPNMGEALESLKGTFALWMFNRDAQKLYITRNASTLFGNESTGDFSSTEFKGSVSLDQGYVYEVENLSSLKKISAYKARSPYLIL